MIQYNEQNLYHVNSYNNLKNGDILAHMCPQIFSVDFCLSMSVYELCDPTPCIPLPSDTGKVTGLPCNWVSWAVADGNYVSNIHASAIITPFSLLNTKLFNINVYSASSFLLGEEKLLFVFSAWCLGLTWTLCFSIVIFWMVFATNKTKLLKLLISWFLRTFWK